MIERRYINASHKAVSEACQKEVEEMAKNLMSHEEFIAQSLRNREEARKDDK